MPTPPRGAWLGAAIVLVAASLFATLGVLSRFAYDLGMAPTAFVAWRSSIGAAALGVAVLAWRGPRAIAGLLRGSGPAGRWLLLATIAGAVLNLAVFSAFERTTVALALLGFYTYPAMVAVVSTVLGHERLDAARGWALVLALAGMAAVVLGGLGGSEPLRVDALGIGLALGAAAAQTVFMLASRGYAALPTDVAMAMLLIGGALFAAAAALVAPGPDALLLPLRSMDLLGLLLFAGVAAAAVPSLLFLAGIRAIGGVRTGILMLFEPLVGVTLAAIFLGEALAPLQALGGATILLAAYLVQRGVGRRPADERVAVAPIAGGP